MNRVGMGLAVGAGYLLGRTKKLKLAVAVGTMVAGKKLNLTPKGIAELVSGQLQNNPQFKEIGDQLRTDLRGVGKAASGAMVERQIGALADRLHGRTAEVRDQLSGAVPKAPGVGSRDSGDSEDPEEYAEQDDERDERDERDGRDADDEPDGRAGRERDGRRPAGKTAPAARKAAKKAPAKKAAVKRAQPAKKATGKKTAGARSAARGAGTRQSKGGGER
ncbi:DNA primase [Streptomyces olivaceus]|uniref:DNA primase n=1 Tax=Streptomyces olivaceus TaxID=47716 RepID=A0ABS7W8P9_STROV|nr:DNA primase [Streptomyces olivaceus]MBZ6091841.1 DNA primase [Streptomyces olivaceus]MBZ6098857.1 DNA primase [Streptomyces olivaceus]MBZ6118909.1 DNA primase [Streptomyces olivaceus]MBZ6154342.1 DNA primase [Streptomyces olivaceus]MBZ6300360.1 DNA primase [Streptomyces olivaceus]